MQNNHSANTDTNTVKISAVLPNYNSVEFLPKSIETLVNQTVPFTEIIIVDDGSTDNSIEVISSYMQKHGNIRLIRHEKNQGVNPTLNTGIKNAIGDYVILCAADDYYEPDIVAIATETIKQHPNVGIVCGDAIVYRYDLKEPFYRMLPYPANTLITADEFKARSKKGYVGFNSGGSMFINRELILSVGMVIPTLRWHGDWMLYCVAAFKQGFYYVNKPFIHISMRKAGYCENGKQNKLTQNQVMLDAVRVIKNQYPELWDAFKASALVPHYAMRYIPLFLADPIAKQFVTMKLAWKMFINNSLVVRIGRLFPYRVILGMRKLLSS